MSSIDVLSNATAALLSAQQQIGVVSQNIGNAQSPNYTARTASTVQSEVGVSGGTKVQVQRAVDVALQNAVLNQTTDSGKADYVANIYSQLENVAGSANGTPLLSSATQGLITAFQAYQATPESSAAQSAAVTAASNLVNTIQDISGSIATIQSQTQNDLTYDVSTLNTALTQVQQLNRNIIQLKANGADASDLQDQRDGVIAQIAGLVPVKQQQNTDGSVSLFTPNGVSLVGIGASNFTFDAGLNTIYASNDPNKIALNGTFTSGKIGGEVNVLRTDPAALQSSDPSHAPLEKVRQQLNAFANLLYAVPPAVPTALQSAYDSASPTNVGELASSLFTFSAPPSGTNDDRDLIAVNPGLLNGTATIKQSAAEQVLVQLTATNNSYSGGNLSLAKSSYAQIANAIASDQSARATQAKSDDDAATTNLSTVTQSYRNQTGVSVDQQLSKLVVLQNAYNAAAKIISTVDSLQQTLFNAVS